MSDSKACVITTFSSSSPEIPSGKPGQDSGQGFSYTKSIRLKTINQFSTSKELTKQNKTEILKQEQVDMPSRYTETVENR